MHFQTSVLGEAGVTFWAFVRFFASMAETMAFEMEGVSKAFPAFFTFEGSFTGMGAEMPAKFRNFDRGIIT